MSTQRTVTYTHVQKGEMTATLPTLKDAMIFVYTLQAAGVQAIVNLEEEDLALV